MVKVINDFKSNSNVDFANSTMGDLEHERSTLARVAVVFRKDYGRPKISTL